MLHNCTVPLLRNTIIHPTTLSDSVTVTPANTAAAQRSVTRRSPELKEAQRSAGTGAQRETTEVKAEILPECLHPICFLTHEHKDQRLGLTSDDLKQEQREDVSECLNLTLKHLSIDAEGRQTYRTTSRNEILLNTYYAT